MSDEAPTRRQSHRQSDGTYLVDGQQQYRVAERLGSGAFGVVFKCFHEETGTWVAIKRLQLDVGDAERAAREASVLGQVHSEYVVKTRACFYDRANSLFYVVTDLASEGNLRHYLSARPHPLAIAEAISMALGLAQGLAAIHGQGIVHLDVKPENVLVHRVDGRMVPKLADFGLARSIGSLSIGGFASPGYAAPEQLAAERCGPESDLFSFGMIVHELLTGQPASGARTLPDYGEFLRGLVARPLPPVDERRPELTGWPELSRLVSGLVAHDRNRRKALSAAEAVRELRRVLEEMEGPPLRRESPAGALSPRRDRDAPQGARAEVRPVRWSRAAIALVVVALLAIGGLGFYFAFTAARHRDAAAAAASAPPVSVASPTAEESTSQTRQGTGQPAGKPVVPLIGAMGGRAQPAASTDVPGRIVTPPAVDGRTVGASTTDGPPASAKASVAPLQKVTAADLRQRLANGASGQLTALLLWRLDAALCVDCEAALRLVKAAPQGIRVIPLAIDQFLQGPSLRTAWPGVIPTPRQIAQARATELVNPMLDEKVANRYAEAGITDTPLLAIPSPGGQSGDSGLRDYLSALGVEWTRADWSSRSKPAAPAIVFVDAAGQGVAARQMAVFAFLPAGEAQQTLTIDPPSQRSAAAYVSATSADPITRAWARLAESLHGLAGHHSLMEQADPSSYTDRGPVDGTWSGYLSANEALRLPVVITGRRKGRTIAIDAIAAAGMRAEWATGLFRGRDGCPYQYITPYHATVDVQQCDLRFTDDEGIRFFPTNVPRTAASVPRLELTCRWEPGYARVDCGGSGGRSWRFDVERIQDGVVMSNVDGAGRHFAFTRVK